MRVVSLFAGIGGIDLGLERAGMTTVAQVENDPWCTQILEKHWPTVPRWSDIHDLDPKELPDHDLIAGGFPCQPVSLAGARLAQDDPRWLWPEFFRIVRMVRPRYVLVENVPGLASAGMGDVLGDLAEIGYDAEWTSIPAAAVGAPHLRWRIFIVAYPAGVGEPILSEGASRESTMVGTEPGASGRTAVGDPPPRVPQPGGIELDSASDVAYAQRGELRDKSRRRDGQGWAGPSVSGDDGTLRTVAYPEYTRSRFRPPKPGRREVFGSNGTYRPSGQWTVEPDVGRVADGVPRRVDRLRGLGNAVVPQVAEVVGRLIMQDHALQSNRR